MADKFDINLNINDNSARKSGGGNLPTPTSKDNSKQIAKEVGKALEKVTKNSNKVLADSIEKSLEKVLRQILSRSKTTQTTGGAPAGTGGGLTSSEITKIISAVTKKGTTDLLNEVAKLKRSGGTRSEGGLSAATERQIQQLVRNLGSVLGSKGITLPPDFGKSVGMEVSKSVKNVISKEFSKASQDATKAWNEVKSSAEYAKKALESISRIKKSGGGIDVKEIGSTIKEIGNLGKSLLSLKKSTEDLATTTKSLAKDQKALIKETSDAAKELKNSIKAQAQKAISDIPSKLKDKETYKKQFDALIKEVDKIAKNSGLDTQSLKKLTEVGKDISNAAAEMKQAAKDIKDAKGIKGTVEAIEKSGEKISSGLSSMEDAFRKAESNTKKFTDSIDKAAGRIESSTKKTTTETKKPSSPDTKKVFEDLNKEFKKFVENVRLELKNLTKVQAPAQKIENYEKERQAFVSAIQSKDPQKIKEALGRGIEGVSQKSANDIREAIVALEKTFNRTPKEFEEFFKKGLAGKAMDVAVEKKLTDIDRKIAEGNKQAADYYKRTSKPAPRVKLNEAPATRDVSSIIAENKRAQSLIKQPRMPAVYPEVPILPGRIQAIPEAGQNTQAFDKSKALVEAKMQGLANSLLDLQKYIVDTLESEFAKAGSNWQVVKGKNEKSVTDFFSLVTGVNAKTSGKQYAFEIANVNQIKKMLFAKGRPARPGMDTKQMVDALTSAIAAESVKNYSTNKELIDKIGDWFKTVSADQIESNKAISRVKKDFVNIKKSGLKGEALSKAISEAIGSNQSDIEEIFKLTIGKVEAMRDLRQQKLVRSVALPAARVTREGAAVFQTSTGAERVLQKFAEYKSGLENVYENLFQKQALVMSKNFAEAIRDVGVSPRGQKLDQARTLARDMLTDFGKVDKENFDTLIRGIRDAAVLKGGTKGTNIRNQIEAAISSIQTNEAGGVKDVNVSINNLIDATEAAGVSMYDVVKTMDSIKFLNVYDVMKKVISGAEGGLQPLVALGKSPNFQKSIRDFETAISQVQGTLPLVQPGRPRSASQQESIVKVFSRTSDIFRDQKRLNPTEQKEYIKDLNIRFQEMFKAEEKLNELYRQAGQKRASNIPEDVRTIASIGIPGAQASEMNLYRTKFSKASNRFLSQLESDVNTMYTDILEDLAPMGEFTQKGREGLSGISSSISADVKELSRTAKAASMGRLDIAGMGTEFPTLRSSREADLIESGRIGRRGYGFNVVTEFKHVAGTMEDQILVSGKLADALTSVTKTLIRPAGAGRVRGGPKGSEKVTEIKPGVLKDQIQQVYNKIQEVMGVPEEYRGRADKAFIDEVTNAISVIRGEEVEVQQARLTEVFLNSFGRKFFSRYGSKGVAAFSTKGLGADEFNQLTQAMASLDADVKVLSPQERKGAGLGVALLPRSAGEMLADIFGEGPESELRKQLLESGNKFILDLFKAEKGGLLIPEEAKTQRDLFEKIATIFEAKTGQVLRNNVEGLRQIIKTAEYKGVRTKEERAIDLRISSKNVAKRGLQPEFFEAMINNLAGVKGAGYTTIPTKLDENVYKNLLGAPGKAGQLSTVAKELGFSTLDPATIKAQAEALAGKAKTPAEAEVIKKRAQAIEEVNNYYTDVIDQFGKARKGIVGEKFFSIVEEPGQTEGWKASDIRRGIKGVSIDIPSFSAYATIFGEQSKLLQEILNSTNIDQKKQLEFIKALRVMADETGTIQDRMSQYLEKVSLNEVKFFEESTGVMADMADDLDPRNLKNTVFDTQRFTKPFLLDIPKVGGEAGQTEPFYVPGPLARGTYDENLIAGEKGIENIGRRLQQVVNMAKKANELLARPGIIRKEIENLEQQLSEAAPGSPQAAAFTTELANKRNIEQRLLSGGEISGTVRKRITEEISKFLTETAEIEQAGKSGEGMIRLQQMYDILQNALSTSTKESERPSEVFRTKKTDEGYLPIGLSERQNVGKFAESQKRKRGEFKGTIDAIRKAADVIIGKGPEAFAEYNLVVDALAELNQGMTEQDSATIREIKNKLMKETEFSGKVGTREGLIESLQKKRTYIEPAVLATMNDINEPVTRLTRDLKAGKGIELATRFGINIDQELQFKYEKAMDGLQRAKIEYFKALAEASIGKKGAVAQGIFRRKYPGVMKKASVAIVDRTAEMNAFADKIKSLTSTYSDVFDQSDISKLAEATQGVSEIAQEHMKTIAISRKQGMPVLKQHELGIPEVTARKIPVKFTKKYKIKGEKINRMKGQEVDSTLYDMLTYIKKLEDVMKDNYAPPDIKKEIAKHLKEDLKPYVEAVRYPFTGVSSVVPFKPKLLTGKMGEAAAKTFVAPGIPDFNIDEFNKYIDKVKEVIGSYKEISPGVFKGTGLMGRREQLQSLSNPTPEVISEINKITDTIKALRAIIDDTIPKYAAHTAKLDFDGDMIAVHSATTREARKEIEDHYKSVAKFGQGISNIQTRFRSRYTSEAATSEQMGTAAALAEAQEKFLKKFPVGEGYEFLTKPFLTNKLEYAKPKEQLSILGIAEEEGMMKAFENLIRDTVTGMVDTVDEEGKKIKVPVADILVDAIKNVESPFTSLEEELKSISELDLEKRFNFGENLLKALEEADKNIEGDFSGMVKKGLTNRVFQDKYKKAVEANLFKIETGIQTESLYRLNRLSEMNIGFGSGLIGTTGGEFKPSELFKKRNPNLKILGGDIEKIAGDYYAMFNELFRFSLQKGMDVKHAGGKSVSGQIVKSISKGVEGATELWQDINKGTGPFGDLKDFIDTINEVIVDRLGTIPTDTIRKELATLGQARGLKDLGPAMLAGMNRQELIAKVQEVIGFKGFLIEMANQVREVAVQSTIKGLQKLSPEKRAGMGDLETYARGIINKQMREGGINIREQITVPEFPLYNIRSANRLTQQLGTYKSRYGDVTVPESVQFTREDQASIDEMMDNYKKAKATAQNLQDAFAESMSDIKPGAYAELVSSALTQIHKEQEQIQSMFSGLLDYGYEFQKEIGSEEYLKSLKGRTLTESNIPDLMRKILEMKPKEQRKQLEKLSDLVGVPSLKQEELESALGFGKEYNLAAEFRKMAEKKVLNEETGGLSKQELEANIQEYASELTDKAKVILEMDRILDVMATRAKEGIDLLALFPKPGSVTSKMMSNERSYAFTKDMARVAREAQASRDVEASLFGPAAGAGAGGGGGVMPPGQAGTPGGGFVYTGGVVPVKIVDIAPGLTLGTGNRTLGPAGIFKPEISQDFTNQLNREARARKLKEDFFETHSESVVTERLKDRAKELDDLVKNWDQHQKRFLDPKFQEILKTQFPDFDLKEFEKRRAAGADPQKLIEEFYKKLKGQKFFSSGLLYQGGSSLGAGGLKKSDVVNPDILRTSQIEKVAQHILGLDKATLDRYQEAAFGIGTALHAKKQAQLKKELGDAVDIEKFTYFEPGEIVKDMQGAITGQIDVAYKNAEGAIQKIEDIKTTGESFAKFSTIKKFVPKGEIGLEELLDKDIPLFLRQKLEDYASQLNVYLAGLKQMAKKGEAKVAEDISAEISFIPTEDTDLGTEPIRIKVNFDPERLKKDMEAVNTARMLVKDYVQHTEKTLEKLPEDLRPIVERLRNRTSGMDLSKGLKIPRRRTPASYKFEEAVTAALGEDDIQKEIDEYVRVSSEIFKFVEGKEGIYEETRQANENIANAVAKQAATQKAQIKTNAEAMVKAAEAMSLGDVEDDLFGKARKPSRRTPEEKIVGEAKGFVEPLIKTFTAMQEFQDASIIAQNRINKFEFKTSLEKMPDQIRKALSEGTPPSGPQFSETLNMLEKEGFISYNEQIQAWKLWRVAMSDFLISQAQDAQKTFELMKASGKPYTREFETFAARVEKLKEFMIRGFGKTSDIYTIDRRFPAGEESARRAGLYMSPEQLFQKSAAPIGQDEFTRGIFSDLIDRLEAGVLGKPAEEIKKIVNELGELNDVSMEVLTNLDLFKRKGDDIDKSLDFGKIADRARLLRAALAQYSMQNFTDDFQTDIDKKFQVRGLLQYLKQIEQVYGRLDLNKAPERGDAGLVKVPGFLPVEQQTALHRENIVRARKLFATAEKEGGAKIGDRFSYFARVVDQAGNVIRNTRVDFYKYKESINDAGEAVGRFTESHKDLIGAMHMAGGTFASALRRVIMWGSAATLVYGGVQKLKESINDLAAIEVSMAQLRMVMNPLKADFEALSRSAVGFAKQYGVGVNEVLKSMKIFAQQGLSQAEIIDRTRVSTLAANVSTLSAADATEALTAAMKSYGGELGSASMALDSWSETEAKHAITAEDMANAIKKSAAAAKNAGFTFNELNGIVAGIGSVTRQTGKEVGTAIRFIARRLFSEKGPKVLGEIGIPTVTDTGELRKGFDILDDLSKKWAELTRAQQLNIAQSLGGTRQYNAVLVAMQNWNEVLDAIRHSTNSKGSAERRNLEIMKTYQKQLEQLKASATELSMQFGEIVFPVFKGAISGAKAFLDILTAIPTPVKAIAAGLTLLFGYAAKGTAVIDTLTEMFSRGSGVISNFWKALTGQAKIATFEIFGKNKIPLFDLLGIDTSFKLDARFLKTMAPGALDVFKPKGNTFSERLGEFQSPLGKLAYTLKTVGDAYNEFLGMLGTKTAGAAGSAANGLDKMNTALQTTGLAISKLPIPPWISKAAGYGIAAISAPTEALEKGFAFVEKVGGKTARAFAESFAAENSGIIKSILPLAATIAGMVGGYDMLKKKFMQATSSAQDYAREIYNTRDVQEESLKTIRELSSAYESLNDRLEQVRRDQKALQTPGELQRRVSLDSYKSPMLELMRIREQAREMSGKFLESEVAAIAGVDQFGNVILSTTKDIKKYIDVLEQARIEALAMTDIDVATKYVKDLTTPGSKIAQEIGAFISEIPLVGEVNLGKTPFKMLDDATKKVNDLLNLKAQYPLSTIIEEDLKKALEQLNKAKKPFDATFKDFRNVLSSVYTKGLNEEAIVRLFRTKDLEKGFDLIAKYEKNVRGISTEANDVLGTEILKKVFPESGGFLDYNSKVIIEKAREAGIQVVKATKDSMKQLSAGDIVTFTPELADSLDAAANVAIAKVTKTGEMVLEFFNKTTGKLEIRPVSDSQIQKMADAIIPVRSLSAEIEDRVAALNTTLTGAAAGISGISEKAFKKDFDLGPRFYSQIPTTTLLQSPRGFAPGAGITKESPLKQLAYTLPSGRVEKRFFSDLIDKYFLEPLEEYKMEVASLSKLELPGLSAKEVNVAKQRADDLEKSRSIIINNQASVQYIALLEELGKTMEENSRVIQENIDLEKLRQETFLQTGGFLDKVAEGLDNLDVGARKLTDLTNKQKTQVLFPDYTRIAGQLRGINQTRDSRREAMLNAQRGLTQLEQLRDMYKRLGVTFGPKEMESLVQNLAVVKNPDTALLKTSQDETTRAVADQTNELVPRVDEILANMGNAEAIIRSINGLQENITKEGTGPEQIVAAMNKADRARIKYEKEGNQQVVAAANSAINTLSKQLVSRTGFGGLSKALSGSRLSEEQVIQRALSGTSPQRLLQLAKDLNPRPVKEPDTMDKLLENLGRTTSSEFTTQRVAGVEVPAVRIPESEITFNDPEQRKEFKNLQKSIEEGNKLRKDGLLTSKNARKATAAALIIQAFNKKATSKSVSILEKQLELENINLHDVRKLGGNIENTERRIGALQGAITKEQKKGQLQSVTQTVLGVTSGTSFLADFLGLDSELWTKLAAVGTSLYGAMKISSSILGEELPAEAKAFGSALGNVTKEYLATGEVSLGTQAELRSKGKELKRQASESFKQQFGQDPLAYQKMVARQMESGEIAPVAPENLVKQLTTSAEASAESSKALQALLAIGGAALVGYGTEKNAGGQRLIRLEKFSEEQAKTIKDFARVFPEAADAAFKEIVKGTKLDTEVPPEEIVKKERQSLALDSEQIFSDIRKKYLDIIESYKDSLGIIDDETKKLKDSMAQLELFTELNTQLSQFKKALTDTFTAARINSQFTGPAMLNPNLKGFYGESELPVLESELTGLQKIFSDLNKVLSKDTGGGFATEDLAQFDAARKARESLQAYNLGIQASGKLTEQLITLTSQYDEYRKSISTTGKHYSLLKEHINSITDSITDLNNRLSKMGEAIRSVKKFTESIQEMDKAFSEIRVREAVEGTEQYKKYTESINKLLGGSSPEAEQMVSVMQQFDAARAGIKLGPTATKYEVREAEIRSQMRGADSEQRRRLAYELSTLGKQKALDRFETEKRKQNDKLNSQLEPLKQLAFSLERLLQTENLGTNEAKVRSLQKEVLSTMAQAAEKISPEDAIKKIEAAIKAGTVSRESGFAEIENLKKFTGNIYKGVDITAIEKFSNAQRDIQKSLLEKIPSLKISELEVAVTDKIVAKLDQQLLVLTEIAKKAGVDPEAIAEKIAAAESQRLKAQQAALAKALEVSIPEKAPVAPKKESPQEYYNRVAYKDKLEVAPETFWEGFKRRALAPDKSFREYTLPRRETKPEPTPREIVPTISIEPESFWEGFKRRALAPDKSFMEYTVPRRGRKLGGEFQKFPSGMLKGPGTGTSDSITAEVSTGEFITKKASVDKIEKKHPGAMAYMNKHGELPKFGDGGKVRGPVNWLMDKYKLPKDSLTLRNLDTSELRNFSFAADDYLTNNPLILNALQKGMLTLNAADIIEARARQLTEDEFAVFDIPMKDVTINASGFKKGKSRLFEGTFEPTVKNKDPYLYLLSHEFGHTQDALIRNALDQFIQFNGKDALPDYAKDMIKVMNYLKQRKTAVSGYVKDEFKKSGMDSGRAENFADLEAINELGNDNPYLKPLVDAYNKTFSPENQKQFIKDFGDYMTGYKKFEYSGAFCGGGRVKKFAEGGTPDLFPPRKYSADKYRDKWLKGDITDAQYYSMMFNDTKGLETPLLDPTAFIGAGSSRLLIKGLPAAASALATQFAGRAALEYPDAAAEIFSKTSIIDDPLLSKLFRWYSNNKKGYNFTGKFGIGGIPQRMANGGMIISKPKTKEEIAKSIEEMKAAGLILGEKKVGLEGLAVTPSGSFEKDNYLGDAYTHHRYKVGQGPSGIGAGPSGPEAKFGETTAMQTNVRYMKEFMAGHKKRMEEAKFYGFGPSGESTRVPLGTLRTPGKYTSTLGPTVKPMTLQESNDLLSLSVGEARKKYGNVQADLLSQYKRLNFAVDNDSDYASSKGTAKSGYYSWSPEKRLGAIKYLLSKPKSEWTALDRANADAALRDTSIAGADLSAAINRAKKDYGFNAMSKYIAEPDLVSSYSKLMKSKSPFADTARERLQKQLTGFDENLVVRTRNLITDPKLLKKAMELYTGMYNRTVSENELQRLIETGNIGQEFLDKLGVGKSKAKFAGGGMIRKSGLVFAHGGEVILPKMQEGGPALFGPKAPDFSMASSLRETTIRIEGGDELVSKITRAIENAQPKTVKVDTEGASVSVNTEGVMIPIDTASIESIGTSISSSIESALGNVSRDTGTKSVGADSLDKLNETIQTVQDKIFVVNDDLTKFKTDTDNRFNDVITYNNLNAAVQTTVQGALQQVNKDIDTNRNNISNLASDMRSIDERLKVQIGDVSRTANQADTIARTRI